MWPHVAGAFDYMEQLRASERTAANRRRDPAFYGMMPVSISHEGYSAKPMHSYWDNFWALRGYKDAVEIAHALDRGADAERMAKARDEFRADLTRLAACGDPAPRYRLPARCRGAGRLRPDLHHDRTGTRRRAGLAAARPAGGHLRALLARVRAAPRRAARVEGLHALRMAQCRRVRTPLGWRERAWEATEYFFRDRRPVEWNQWAEVVSSTPRTPFFVGDLPHAWVASDFLRSALDMFAYTRERDDSLVCWRPACRLTGCRGGHRDRGPVHATWPPRLRLASRRRRVAAGRGGRRRPSAWRAGAAVAV